MGMTQEMADNLFKMKSEYQRQGTQGEPSTGLGLLICKEFVSLHKGQITVNAREGKGTVFHIVLPAAVNATDPIDASPS
jgi:signal transduction histidine kinase